MGHTSGGPKVCAINTSYHTEHDCIWFMVGSEGFLKYKAFNEVRSTSEISDICDILDEIYLVFTEKVNSPYTFNTVCLLGSIRKRYLSW